MRTHMRSRSVADISGNQRGPSAGSFRRRTHQQPSSALISTHLLISPEIEIDPQSDAIRRNQTQSDAIRRNQTCSSAQKLRPTPSSPSEKIVKATGQERPDDKLSMERVCSV
jgi:hypothetical protein